MALKDEDKYELGEAGAGGKKMQIKRSSESKKSVSKN